MFSESSRIMLENRNNSFDTNMWSTCSSKEGHHKYDVHVISVLLFNFALTVLLIIEDEDVINSEDAKSFTLSMLIHTK